MTTGEKEERSPGPQVGDLVNITLRFTYPAKDGHASHCAVWADAPGVTVTVAGSAEQHAMRGDAVERWIKAQRNKHATFSLAWQALDEALEDYRLHADTGTPLDEEASEGVDAP